MSPWTTWCVLGDVEVLSPEAESLRLGTLWEGRAVLLAMIRHFG
jgi:hypothetical protein